MGQPAIFLDRDGVLNENRDDHVKSWLEFSFLPGSLDALAVFAKLPYRIVTVTNQAIVNRGIVPAETVDDIHRRMLRRVGRAAGRIDRVYYCPHARDEACDCRKPEPGMLLRAATDLDIDLTRSIFVGDATSDIVAGQRAGCGTVLVRTGRGFDAVSELSDNPFVSPDAVVANLFDGIPIILQLLAERSDETLVMNTQRGAA